MTHNIRLIALDLDGTLLSSDQQITPRTADAITKALEQGVKVLLATGKTRYSAEGIIRRFNLDTPGVYVQGLAIHYPDGRVRHLATLDAALLRNVITFAEDRGFDVAAYSGERILTRAESREANELATTYGDVMPEAVGPLQNILDSTPINKLIIIKRHQPRKIAAIRWQLGMQLNGKAHMVQALDDMLEILPLGTSKGKAVKMVVKELGIAPEHVLAIGDGENDIEMLQMAGIGVAMGNANPKLKAIADYTVASNDADGVAEAIERFALRPEEPAAEDEPTSATQPTTEPADATTQETKAE